MAGDDSKLSRLKALITKERNAEAPRDAPDSDVPLLSLGFEEAVVENQAILTHDATTAYEPNEGATTAFQPQSTGEEGTTSQYRASREKSDEEMLADIFGSPRKSKPKNE